MFSRPKPGETEEDLLRQQEEFLRNKNSAPAATLINKRKSHEEIASGNAEDTSKKLRSKFAANKVNRNTPLDRRPPKTIASNVLGEIQEKNVSGAFAPPPKTVAKQGFPEVFIRDKTLVATGKSIFAQQAAKSRGIESSVMDVSSVEIDDEEVAKMAEVADVTEEMENKRFGEKSYILTCEDVDTIHRENVVKLSQLSEEDILKEQQKLMDQIDPNLLQFIRSKRKKEENKDLCKDSVRCEIDTINEMKTVEECDNNDKQEPVLMKDDEVKTVEECDNNDKQEPGLMKDVSQEAILNLKSECEMSVPSANDLVNEQISETDKMNTENSEAEDEPIDLPITREETKRWLHMDVVEPDKLRWIGDIPSAPPLPPGATFSARFSLGDGRLMPYAEEKMDVTKALYHHGEEPARPGYTIQEIIQLTRSSVLQQRVVAVNTIAGILDKTKGGMYDECFDSPLLITLIDADLYLLLRFLLDESSMLMITADLSALKNLLCNRADELCLDRLLGLWNGHVQPSLMAKSEVKKQSEIEELKQDEVEMKDYQLLKLDMIKGALRTDLLLRFRYILDVVKPEPKSVVAILEILTRIARHSYDSALAVSNCPGLLTTIITEFIPTDWRTIIDHIEETTDRYSVSLVDALKLLRVIASCSRSLASNIVHNYGVMDSLVSYISVDPKACCMPLQEVRRLGLESLYLWNTMLAYNYATVPFSYMYPVLMRLLQYHISVTAVKEAAWFAHEHGAALITLITQALLAADAQMKRAADPTQQIPVTLTYENLSGFGQPLRFCLKKWLNQLQRIEREVKFTTLKLITAILNCMAVWITKFHNQPGVDCVSMLEEIGDLMNSSVLPLLKCQNFKMLCARVKSCSCLLNKQHSGKDRDPSCLPSLGSLLWGGSDLVLSVSPRSPFAFLQGLAHFLTSVCSVHRGFHSQCVEHFLDNPRILGYVTELGKKKLHEGDTWFTRVETTMLAHMLKLLSVVLPITDFQHVGVYHNMAIRLVALISTDEKFLAKEILKQVVFNIEFFRDCSDITYGLEALKLDIASKPETASIHSLLEAATNKIPSIWQCYESALGLADIKDKNPLDITSQTVNESGLEPAFPNDWSYLPILQLYNVAVSGKPDSSDNTNTVINSLQWLLIVECLRPQSTTMISVTAKFCRLSTVFLAGNDLFLNPEVHNLLDALLQIVLKNNNQLNFNENISGLSSFYDLYTQLVEQFAAVSYGDELFGQFVLIPLQQKHSPSFRKLVWSEHAAILRVLRTKPEQLPLKEYLEPCETDSSLLTCYFRGIVSGQVREMWCPVLYRVAVHHVGAFITQHPENSLAQQFKSRIKQLGDKVPSQWRTESEQQEM